MDADVFYGNIARVNSAIAIMKGALSTARSYLASEYPQSTLKIGFGALSLSKKARCSLGSIAGGTIYSSRSCCRVAWCSRGHGFFARLRHGRASLGHDVASAAPG